AIKTIIMHKLSIIVPVHNEVATLSVVIDKIRLADSLGLLKEIIVVDDGSTDGSIASLRSIADLRIIKLPHNQGKGAAVAAGLNDASGDIIMIQDADLEYDPTHYPRLLQPLLDKKTTAVYGTRFHHDFKFSRAHPLQSFTFWLGNKLLTIIFNLIFGTALKDIETGYKVMTRSTWLKITPLRFNDFRLEPELTAKIARNNLDITEIPISYNFRRVGKKIKYRDGWLAISAMIKLKWFK
ncbi:MAG: glycosyltransferase family 2 protein, partial [Candidatus Komeilibacteria bacterium]|nr:glycosyltransferase family 2 protein [Candidatus Komeilibacteria bacterium]